MTMRGGCEQDGGASRSLRKRGLDHLDSVPEQSRATDLCRVWLDEVHSKHEGFVPSWGIALLGDPGVGKTAIACALAHDADALGVSVDFVTMPDLRYALPPADDVDGHHPQVRKVDDDTPEIVEHRALSKRIHELRNEIQLLIIDDLGRELKGVTGTGWIESQIDNLVRHRGDRGLALGGDHQPGHRQPVWSLRPVVRLVPSRRVHVRARQGRGQAAWLRVRTTPSPMVVGGSCGSGPGQVTESWRST